MIINWVPIVPPQHSTVSQEERTTWRNLMVCAPLPRNGAIAFQNESLLCAVNNVSADVIELWDCRCLRYYSGAPGIKPAPWVCWIGSYLLPEQQRDTMANNLLNTKHTPPINYSRKLNSIVFVYGGGVNSMLHMYDCTILRRASVNMSDLVAETYPSIATAGTITMPNRQTGFVCLGRCNMFFTHVEPNRPNGYICRECRS